MQEITVRKIQEPQFSGNFEIIDLGQLLVDQNMEEGLHRHDFFFLLVLEAASGKHHIDFQACSVVPNSITLIRPGQVHELLVEQGSKGYLITFDHGYYTSNFSTQNDVFWKVFQRNFYSFGSAQFTKLKSICDSIFDEHTQSKEGHKTIIKANLDILFTTLHRHALDPINAPQTHTPYEQEILEKFTHLLESHICTNKQVTTYAEMLNITPYKLNTITKNLLDKTSSQMINEQIVLEAKRLLLATSNQINEIAFALCYQDPAYFVRFFKKHTGHTPQAFRQNFK